MAGFRLIATTLSGSGDGLRRMVYMANESDPERAIELAKALAPKDAKVAIIGLATDEQLSTLSIPKGRCIPLL